MSAYDADPRAEELQLLRQIGFWGVRARHSSTLAILKRLEAKGEARSYTFVEKGLTWWWIDYTSKAWETGLAYDRDRK